jgi:hypothetical protein
MIRNDKIVNRRHRGMLSICNFIGNHLINNCHSKSYTIDQFFRSKIFSFFFEISNRSMIFKEQIHFMDPNEYKRLQMDIDEKFERKCQNKFEIVANDPNSTVEDLWVTALFSPELQRNFLSSLYKCLHSCKILSCYFQIICPRWQFCYRQA